VIRRRFLPLCLLTLSAFLPAETLRIERPILTFCQTAVDVDVSLVDGMLRPGGGLFSFYPPDMLPLLAAVAFPQTADRGTVLRVQVLLSEDPETLSVELTDPDGRKACQARGFRAGDSGGSPLWLVLLPLPSDMKGGDCKLSVNAAVGPRSMLFRARLPIGSRGFVAETIDLTDSLTNLRSAPDPKRDEQAVELWNLLQVFNPGALFETDGFSPPVDGLQRRSAFYGDRREYRNAGKPAGTTLHGGVDIAVPEGTTVRSCGKGRVAMSSDRILTGNTVVVEHLPGLYSLYYHMSKLLVKQGDLVEKGQPVGLSGMTGLATGPHLHWEVQAQGVPVDPDFFIGEPLLDKGETLHGIIDTEPSLKEPLEGR